MYLHNSAHEVELSNEESYYQIKILETSNSRKTWNKGLAEIQYEYNSQNGARLISKKLLFYTDSNSIKLISEGDILLLSSKISEIRNNGNPGEFDAVLYWKSKKTNLLTFFDYTDFSILKNEPISNKNALQNNLIETLKKHLPKSQVGLAQALFLGDKSALSTETKNAFSAAGAMHLLAISGLHIGLMILVLINTFRVFSRYISRYQATCIVILFIWLYAYLIGFPPSVVRSVFMFSLITLGALFSAQNNQLNLLCFSAVVLLLLNPWFLFDIGFQLSYLAMFGIFLTYHQIQGFYVASNKVTKLVWNGTALGLSAQIFTVPLCLYYFHQFPNYFVLTNLGIILISGILISVGAGLFVFTWSPILSVGIGFVLSTILYLLIYFIDFIEQLPGSVSKGFELSEFELLGIYFLVLVLVLLAIYRAIPVLKYFLTIAILCVIALHRYHQMNETHLILYNNNTFCFAIHTQKHIYFFYDDSKENEYKFQRLMESYEKCYPGEISMVSVKDKNISSSFKKHRIAYQTIDQKKYLTLNHSKFQIIHDNSVQKTQEENLIGMPWIEGLDTTLKRPIIFPLP